MLPRTRTETISCGLYVDMEMSRDLDEVAGFGEVYVVIGNTMQSVHIDDFRNAKGESIGQVLFNEFPSEMVELFEKEMGR